MYRAAAAALGGRGAAATALLLPLEALLKLPLCAPNLGSVSGCPPTTSGDTGYTLELMG